MATEPFFQTKQPNKLSPPKGAKKELSCLSCGLHLQVKSPRMEPFGEFGKGILNVGEAPGEVEYEKGKQWQGPAGHALQEAYTQLGIDLFADCLNINAVNCRPVDEKGNNRAPTSNEIACCRQRVLQVIDQYKPQSIVLLGGVAVQSVLGFRWKKDPGGITRWRGFSIPDRYFKSWIFPTFHPSYVERSGDKREAKTVWMRDLKHIAQTFTSPFPQFREEEKCIEVISDLSALLTIQNGWASFDYETTGLKPHSAGHRIVCVTVADAVDHCFSFILP